MGTPLPRNPVGPSCPVCWGVGKTFGNTGTPKYIELAFFDFQPGQHWLPEYEQLLLTPHTLVNTGLPCNFGINDGVFLWTLVFTVGNTFVAIQHVATGKIAFATPPPVMCATELTDTTTSPVDRIAMAGTVTINPYLGGG